MELQAKVIGTCTTKDKIDARAWTWDVMPYDYLGKSFRSTLYFI